MPPLTVMGHTAGTITQLIADYANELWRLTQQYSNVQDSDSAQYIADPDAQAIAVNEILGEMRDLEQRQREAQAIAAQLAQPGTPSVVGPGAVNVAVNPTTGVATFVTTPPGTAGGSSSPTAQPGTGGPITPGSSAPAGPGPSTMSASGGLIPTSLADAQAKANDFFSKIFPATFLPNVPRWALGLGAIALAFGLFKLSTKGRA